MDQRVHDRRAAVHQRSLADYRDRLAQIAHLQRLIHAGVFVRRQLHSAARGGVEAGSRYAQRIRYDWHGMEGKTYDPCSSVSIVRVMPRPSRTAVTLALGTALPDASVTVPWMVPTPCPNTELIST